VIEAGRFQPASIAVSAGDTVEWTNKDLFPHTVTAATTGPKQKPRFDSGAIQPGATWRLTTTASGDFAYVCSFHVGMRANLTVRGPGR